MIALAPIQAVPSIQCDLLRDYLMNAMFGWARAVVFVDMGNSLYLFAVYHIRITQEIA